MEAICYMKGVAPFVGRADWIALQRQEPRATSGYWHALMVAFALETMS